MLWQHLANEAKEAEMSKQLESATAKCETAVQSLEKVEQEKEQLVQEKKSELEKKDKEFAQKESVKNLNALLQLNQRRALTQLFNRWNTSSERMKKEEEVTLMKDQQRTEEVTALTQKHTETVTALESQHEESSWLWLFSHV